MTRKYTPSTGTIKAKCNSYFRDQGIPYRTAFSCFNLGSAKPSVGSVKLSMGSVKLSMGSVKLSVGYVKLSVGYEKLFFRGGP